MPYPGQTTPEGIMANMREIERWGNALPLQRSSNFVPYYLKYSSPTPETTWEFSLIEMMHDEYATEVIPTGLWFYSVVMATIAPVVGTTGLRATLNLNLKGEAWSTAGYAGYWMADALRVVKNIDFITPDVEYEWVLPDLYDTSMGAEASAYGFTVVDEDGGLEITGQSEYCFITDPDVGPESSFDESPSIVQAFAIRIADGYSVPSFVEDVSP